MAVKEKRVKNQVNKNAYSSSYASKQPSQNKYRRDKNKRISKGRDYFFVMRKKICFLMFLLFAVCLGLFVVGYLNIVPQYSSLYVEPDYTPQEERFVEDEEGELIEKLDESVHFSTVDPIFGFIKKIVNKELAPSPKYDEMADMVEVGVADIISSIAMTYFPIAMILFAIVAFISMLKAFFAIFGKRIFRLFGLGSFWMVIFALVVVVAGVASNMPIESNLDFAQIVPFLTGALLRPIDGPPTAAGYGLLAMIVLPILTLLLSIFCKKKIPYNIFD